MANVLTISEVNAVRVSEREKTIRYNVTLSGSYVRVVRGADTGEVLKLETAANPNSFSNAYWGPNGPSRVYVINGPAGYATEIIPGGTPNHWLLKIFTAANTEVAAGTYAAGAAGITADVDFTIEASGRSFD
jgi:hypothetical protein